jgi:hypothetical protein
LSQPAKVPSSKPVLGIVAAWTEAEKKPALKRTEKKQVSQISALSDLRFAIFGKTKTILLDSFYTTFIIVLLFL